jgi:hypothetical protein
MFCERVVRSNGFCRFNSFVVRPEPAAPEAEIFGKSRQQTVAALPHDRFPATVAKISTLMILNDI